MRTRSVVASLGLVLVFGLWCSPAARAEDTSTYRGFRLGMTVLEVATEAGLPPEAARTIFERPLLIQELEWRPASEAGIAGAPGRPDSVGQVLFGFCDGELYRMVVRYDEGRTEGLTEQDLIAALSAEYGAALRPLARIITSPASQSYDDTEQVTARWQDTRSSVNLFRTSYGSRFGLVIFSRTAAPVARAGIEKALQFARLDAPRRQAAEQQAREDLDQATHAKARVANKSAFRI